MKTKREVAILGSISVVLVVTMMISRRHHQFGFGNDRVAADQQTSLAKVHREAYPSEPSPKETRIVESETNHFSAAIVGALSKSWRIPVGITLQDLESVDEQAILRHFNAQAKPTNRLSHLVILNAIGSDLSVQRIISMLSDEFSGQKLTDDDLFAMRSAILSLGYISARSAQAKEFLERSVHEDFWAQTRAWQVERQPELLDAELNLKLAQECLVALGAGGHEESLQFAELLRGSTLESQKRWGSTVVDAMFYLDRARNQKRKILPELGEDFMRDFVNWAESDRGRYWTAWNQSLLEGEDRPEK